MIEDQLEMFNGLCEYPIYLKALIKRQRGEIQESLQLFQVATCLNPHSVANLKQVRNPGLLPLAFLVLVDLLALPVGVH